MIWIIGGTSEAREIVADMGDLGDYIVTVATDEGKEFINTEKLLVGGMDYGAMEKFCMENKISLILDLTHPYAEIVSKNAEDVSGNLNIKYIRYTRPKTKINTNIINFRSYEETYAYLSTVSGTVFFTTGSKNIGDFEKVKGDNRFVYRVLPSVESLKVCKNHNISMKDIVAVLGPFSKEYNKAIFKEYDSKYCVMKDSGQKGGTPEKLQACEELGIIPIVIGRKFDNETEDLKLIEEIIRNKAKITERDCKDDSMSHMLKEYDHIEQKLMELNKSRESKK